MERGISQKDLAQKAQVSRSRINDIENCDSNPTIDTICRLSKALEVKPEDLFDCDV